MKNSKIFELFVIMNWSYCIGQFADDCIRTVDRAPGRCIPVAQCQLEEESNEMEPERCSFGGYDNLVCCPDDLISDEEIIINRLGAPKRVSERKCQEYSKFVIQTNHFGPLSVDGAVYTIDVDKCKFDSPLIVGGQEAKKGEFPHMAAIGWMENINEINFKCGGSVISDEYVLTAAHCTSDTKESLPDVVRLGDHNLKANTEESDVEDYGIEKFVQHPDYKRNSIYNDISLIKLSRTIRFNKYTRPACLWSDPHSFTTDKVVASGWGQVEYLGSPSDVLRKVVLDLISNNYCSTFFQDSELKKLKFGVIDTQMCAGVLAGGRDTCRGDSGGPLQIVSKRNACVYYIIGITSFGKFCAFENQPAVYTRVSSYVDWIEPIVWPNED